MHRDDEPRIDAAAAALSGTADEAMNSAGVGSQVSFWRAVSGGGDTGAIFAQIERRDAEALAELTIGLRMLSLLLTLSGSAMALFFLSPEENVALDPSLRAGPLLRFHDAYVTHFPAVAIILLFANLLLIGGLVYIQFCSGYPRALVREFGFGKAAAKPAAEWRTIFLQRLDDAIRTTARMEKLIFLGAALIVVIIPVQLAVVAAIVTIVQKAMA